MNPIEVLYCWQALLCAAAVVFLTQLIKTLVDIIRGHVDPTMTPKLVDKARVGAELRKQDRILNKIVFPTIPVVLGVVWAIFVPARPDGVMTYVNTHHLDETAAMLVFAGWGGACGQFADYIFDKVKGAFEAVIASRLSGMGVSTTTSTTIEVKPDATKVDAVVVSTKPADTVAVAPDKVEVAVAQDVVADSKDEEGNE